MLRKEVKSPEERLTGRPAPGVDALLPLVGDFLAVLLLRRGRLSTADTSAAQ